MGYRRCKKATAKIEGVGQRKKEFENFGGAAGKGSKKYTDRTGAKFLPIRALIQ